MVYQQIRQVKVTKKTVKDYTKERWEFKPKKYIRLANFLWKFLRKIDAVSNMFETYDVWTYTPEHNKLLTKEIHKHINGVLRYYMEKPDDFVLVCGNSDFKTLLHSPDFAKTISFDTGPYVIGHKDDHPMAQPSYTVMGIPIHVVPWIEGYALLPKRIIDKVNDNAYHK